MFVCGEGTQSIYKPNCLWEEAVQHPAGPAAGCSCTSSQAAGGRTGHEKGGEGP